VDESAVQEDFLRQYDASVLFWMQLLKDLKIFFSLDLFPRKKSVNKFSFLNDVVAVNNNVDNESNNEKNFDEKNIKNNKKLKKNNKKSSEDDDDDDSSSLSLNSSEDDESDLLSTKNKKNENNSSNSNSDFEDCAEDEKPLKLPFKDSAAKCLVFRYFWSKIFYFLFFKFLLFNWIYYL
jgi:hypothetical protein